jgi:hypothetical protein
MEAAIGIEPMNKAFAELNTDFIYVHLSYLNLLIITLMTNLS